LDPDQRRQEGTMSKIVITCAMTVDGLIESPAPRPYGWLVLEGESGSRVARRCRSG
jgi:hypothetical protein